MIKTAFIKTTTPSKYISRLCKHFAHKTAVEYDDNEGKITFNMGQGLISKTAEGLLLQAEADNEQDLAQVVDIMDRHFVRIAWQEELTLQWVTQ